MNRQTLRVRLFTATAASAIVAMVPFTSAGAQSLASSLVTPEQARAEYVDQGFQASTPISWWTDGSTTFTVQDPAEQNSPSARVVMVIVYPDMATAQAHRNQGARLVPGFGPSVWEGNVALVQASQVDLARRYAAEVNSNDPTFIRTTAEPEIARDAKDEVGLDFLAVLQSPSTANL